MEKSLVLSGIEGNWAEDISSFDNLSETRATTDVFNGLEKKLKNLELESDVVGSVDRNIAKIDGPSETDRFLSKNRVDLHFPVFHRSYNVLNKRFYSRKTKTWIGQVYEIKEDTVFTKLYDNEDNTTYETAEFSLKDDISKDDKRIISIGSVFYWYVGYVSENGTIKRESQIRLRRVFQDQFEDNFDCFIDKINDDYNKITWE